MDLVISSILTIFCVAGLSLKVCAQESEVETFIVSAAETSKPLDDPRLIEIAREMQRRVESGEFQSLAIGVIESNKVVWANTWGWANREANVRSTASTPYGIASIGKSITAIATMVLIEEGKLDLDTTVDQILGSDAVTLSVGSRYPSIRELLNMTAGVPHGAVTYLNDAELAQEAKIFEKQAMVVFPPGQSFHYSNFSIALLDKVIEEVSGMEFPDFLKRRVFDPLGMENSSIGLSTPNAAKRYFSDGTRVGEIKPFPRSSRQMSSSLNDLLKLTTFHLASPLGEKLPILTKQILRRMQSETSGRPGAHMALGIANLDIGEEERWIVSSGNDMGVQSHISMIPSQDLGVVVLTNSSGMEADEIAIQVVDCLEKGFANRATSAFETFQSHTKTFTVNSEWAGKWKGKIKTADGDTEIGMSFTSDDKIFVSLDGVTTQVTNGEIREGMLTGHFEGNIVLFETSDSPQSIELGLQIYDGEIVGFILANFSNGNGKFQIPTMTRLKKSK